jgi:hypothetical protein
MTAINIHIIFYTHISVQIPQVVFEISKHFLQTGFLQIPKKMLRKIVDIRVRKLDLYDQSRKLPRCNHGKM